MSSVAPHASSRFRWIAGGVCATSIAVALVVTVWTPHDARSALAADWPPFLLVAALCALGFVAHRDGAFTWTAEQCAWLGQRPVLRFITLMSIVAVVTITLNLDTAAVFVTPVVVLAARQRGDHVEGALYGSIVMANASSLVLVGSNLTNLLVLRHSTITAGTYVTDAVAPGLAALTVSAVVVAVWCRPRSLVDRPRDESATPRPHWETGIAIAIAVAFMVVLRNPAVPVFVDALALTVVSLWRRTTRTWSDVATAVAPLTLVTLLALSVVAGALGREWMTPPNVTHGTWVPGLVGAGASIVMNNLPAASLLAAHGVPSPVPLLIGLDLGPNLFVTGSLAWVLWWRAIRHTGLAPSLSRAVLISATSAVVAIPVALAVYALTT